MAKREIAYHENYLCLPQCFKMSSAADTSKCSACAKRAKQFLITIIYEVDSRQ